MLLRKTIVKIIGLLCLLVINYNSYAQKRPELKNIVTHKVRKIKENDRITVHTKYFKIKGLLKIIDKKTIMINGRKIKIDDIIKINTKASN